MHDVDLRWRRFYDRYAPYYDWSMRLSPILFGFNQRDARRQMVDMLRLQPGDRVLEVSVGTGSNLPFMSTDVGGGGELVGLDLSTGMLRQCRKNLRSWGVRARLIEGEASQLPFADNTFDGVLHFGGINEFGDRRGALAEMMRVARPGAHIVVGDEGFAPAKERTVRGRLLLRVNSLYAHQPPLDLLPASAQDVYQTWIRGDACYLIGFVKP